VTRARAAVLSAIDAAATPLAAADVAAALAGICDQATVYRALHYLEDSGNLESFVLYCAEHGVERYYVTRKAAHRHWFHCESCHRFLDIGTCKVGGLVSTVERELGVRVSQHTFYITGLCSNCLNKRDTSSELVGQRKQIK
jgi:Fur family transcriptional regulator, ferric uptake regulator